KPPPLPCLTSPAEIRQAVLDAQREGVRVGLVPTMGALHEGHLSLVDAARQNCGLVIATIFVNPTQFAPHEDLQKYPRDLEADLQKLAERGCHLVFAPDVETMYGPHHTAYVDVGDVALPLEGAARPTHFRGVATIVLKLFHIVPADAAYFGQKDYQQTLVVKRMVADFDMATEICICPIVREPDGLAMSSRNAYLSPEERRRALSLSQALKLARRRVAEGERSTAALTAEITALFEQTGGVAVDYVAFVAADSVQPVETVDGPTVLALAARVGGTRLIDNCRLN
ncbi:MAG: pantoate--beta-alanine ligase, partial [Planctomycetales bacterium]|nr:pantoate--beta-alanine ligase [Planctomycetales bacterium]